MNPLEALLRLRRDRYQLQDSLKMIEEFESDNLEAIAHEADGWGGQYDGHDIQVRSGGMTYSYKNIPEWQQAQAALKAVEGKYKSFFDASQKGALMATEDGEEIPLPEVSYRKSSIVIRKLKEV